MDIPPHVWTVVVSLLSSVLSCLVTWNIKRHDLARASEEHLVLLAQRIAGLEKDVQYLWRTIEHR